MSRIKERPDDLVYIVFFIICLAGLGLERTQLLVEHAGFTQYLDELIAMLAVPAAVISVIRKDKPVFKGKMAVIGLILLIIYWLSGWAGFFINHYQPFVTTAKDAYGALKFLMTILAAVLIFSGIRDFKKFYRVLWPVINIVTVALTVLTVLDLAFDLFYTETRWGLPAIRLFYYTYTDLTAVCVLLCGIYLRFYEEKKHKVWVFMAMLAFILLNTKRLKAMAALAIIVVLYVLILKGIKGLGRYMKLMTGACVGLVVIFCAVQALFYYKLGNESARYVLAIAGPWLAVQYFPFGTGWGTFGCAASADPYSPVYTMYGINQVWGLSESFHSFISDTFWPMLMGQCGFFGCAAFALLILLLFRDIMGIRRVSRSMLASALLPFFYLLVSSTSEASFASYISVSLGLWIGLLLAEYRKSIGRTDN